MINEFLILLGVVVSLWIILMILAPFYLITEKFLEDRIRASKTSKMVAKKLKGKTKLQTLKNIYRYINDHYYGAGHQLDYIAFPEVFDFEVVPRLLLKHKRFLWCSNQLSLLTSLLVNSGHFTKEEISLRRTFGRTLSAHFYSQVNIGDKAFKVDPFYDIFRPIK